MSPYARLVYIALKARYSINLRNNGRIYLSVRVAARETGLSKNAAARSFHEMRHYGFVVMTAGGCLGVGGRGKAPHWRLTELGYMTDPPTRDFLRWGGTIFQPTKIESRPLGRGRVFPRKGHTTVPSEGTVNGTTVPSEGTYEPPRLSPQKGHN
jgi:hypothetical protein